MKFSIQTRDGMWWSDGEWEDSYSLTGTARTPLSLLRVCQRGWNVYCSDRSDRPPRQRIAFAEGDVLRVVEFSRR